MSPRSAVVSAWMTVHLLFWIITAGFGVQKFAEILAYADDRAIVHSQVVVDTADKPGVRDRANFDLHWSVDYWQNFTLPPAIEDSATGPIPSR